jgi:tetratricopeptide (TPR) repeat protein
MAAILEVTSMSLAGKTVRNIRLIEPLGEGGMGEVWLGVDDNLGRRVAVKAIRSERRLDTDAKERFVREAQILSQLEHANICRLYDYVEEPENDFLILELVQGTSLADAIESGLDPAQRMEIAEQIVRALVAAHSMSVVHRDLKPENVMITPDGEVKVLDFGLARAESDQSTDTQTGETPKSAAGAATPVAASSSLTQLGTVMGTPWYMSPEQARGEVVTAASDMYSLGLVLQKLFTGEDPYEDLERTEIIHFARWGETREVRGLGSRLTHLIQRLKSFSPQDRPSALEVAERLRFIRDTPRRRLLRAAAAAVVICLAGAAVVSTLGLRQTRRALAEAERARSQAAAVSRFLEDTLSSADPQKQGIDVKVVEVLERAASKVDEQFADHAPERAAVHLTLARTYSALGQYAIAYEHASESVTVRRALLGADHPDSLESMDLESVVLRQLGRYDEAEALSRDVLEGRREVQGPDHQDTAGAMSNLATVLQYQARFDEAEGLLRRALEIRRTELGDEHDRTLITLNSLGNLFSRSGRWAEAETVFSELLETRRRVSGASHPLTLLALANRAACLTRLGRLEEAEADQREAIELRREVLGDDHPDTLLAMNGLATTLRRQNRHDEAEALLREVLDRRLEVLGEDHPRTPMTMTALAVVLMEQQRLDEAEALYRRALAIERRTLGDSHKQPLGTAANLANLLTKRGRLDDAEALYRQIVDRAVALLGDDHPETLEYIGNLGIVLENKGQLDEAERLTRQVFDTMRRTLGPDDPKTLFWQTSLAQFLQAHGGETEAEPLLREVLERRRRLHGDDDRRTRRAVSNLAAVLRQLGRDAEAAELEAKLPPSAK